jgi:dCMP deaminase
MTSHRTTEELLQAAVDAARASPNRVRRVGAVLVSADGTGRLSACNTFPHGVQDTEFRHQGNGRLVWMEHAERNAIFAAARVGMATDGATLAASFFPCLECARAIVQSGIRHLHTLPPALDDPVWGASFIPSRAILEEGGVQLHFSDRDPAAVHAATMAAPSPAP